MVDKFTKWIEAKPVKTTESGPVIDFIPGLLERYHLGDTTRTGDHIKSGCDEVKI